MVISIIPKLDYMFATAVSLSFQLETANKLVFIVKDNKLSILTMTDEPAKKRQKSADTSDHEATNVICLSGSDHEEEEARAEQKGRVQEGERKEEARQKKAQKEKVE